MRKLRITTLIVGLFVFLFVSENILSSTSLDNEQRSGFPLGDMNRSCSPLLRLSKEEPVILYRDDIYQSLQKFGLEKILRVDKIVQSPTLLDLYVALKHEGYIRAFTTACSANDAQMKHHDCVSKHASLMQNIFQHYPAVCALLKEYEKRKQSSVRTILPVVSLMYEKTSIVKNCRGNIDR